MTKVSVIMGIYNTNKKEKLEKALKSILNQTFKDFEMIICDDGSTNECIEWAKDICGDDRRVKFISNGENKGLAYTLNHCLKVAKGKYIARMDDDDESHLDRFEKQVDFLDKNKNIGIVGSCMNLFDDNGIWGKRMYPEYVRNEDFLYRVAIPHPTIMARRESYDRVGGYRDIKNTVRVEDYDCFMRMQASGIKMYNFQEPLFDYREDSFGAKKKKYKFRFNEMWVRKNGFKLLKIKGIKKYFYTIKPLLAGLIPQIVIKRSQRIP